METKALLLAAGAAVAYGLLTKAHALGSLNFYPGNIEGVSLEGVSPTMQVGLVIQNTTTEQLHVSSIAGNIYDNDFLVGNVGFFSPFSINANSQITITIPIRFGFLSIVSDIISSFENNVGTHLLEWDGAANVDNFQIPIKIKYKIGL